MASATRVLSKTEVPVEAVESPPAPGVRRISIGSYNIHSCIGLDRRCSPLRIANVLKELDCDIYALQEVDNEPGEEDDSQQLEYLSETMDMAAIPGLRIVRHSGEYGNALLTRFPVLSVHRHDLSYGKWLEPRGALDVELDVGGRALRVIATHLGLSRSERRFQWRQLLDAVSTSPPEHPTVVLGDMNEWFPRAGTLRDAHKILGQALAPPEFPSFWPFLALTRIWVRPVQALVSVAVHNTPLAKRASDHLPLRAEIDVERFTQSATD
ncbi:endonuclease/exonuclease/phosphatase family protein [Steroidobacter sp. S1-65]|uniref:Endonuclease/exonuclease/phosphatase family protein n=1 Tax=Steroidobacter gossypii TaxID=2805490 RepID=A0ABS1WRE0_9GAMM|nr:endonuclease/exonuclease/phosphatase family protein [Steroidobacter gossypii]MBM0103540.1 endonuclease/exonuclease/phosphatase family protein [Steroidobacter gossypii]